MSTALGKCHWKHAQNLTNIINNKCNYRPEKGKSMGTEWVSKAHKIERKAECVKSEKHK